MSESALVTKLASAATLFISAFANAGQAQEVLPWQTETGATQTVANGLAVTPLAAALELRLGALDAFGLYAELIDRDGGTSKIRVTGEGSLRLAESGDGDLALDLVISEIQRDGVSLAAPGMIARITASLNPQGYATRSRTTYWAPGSGVPLTAGEFAVNQIARSVARALTPGLVTLPRGPIQMGTPVFDVTPRLANLATGIAGARLDRAPEAGRVVGAAQYLGRLCVVAVLDTTARITLERGGADFAITGEQLIDVATGLPLYTRTHIVGSVIGGSLAGEVDLSIRIAITLPGMPAPNFNAAAP